MVRRLPIFIFAVVVLLGSLSVRLEAQDAKRGLGAGSSAISNGVNARWGYNWSANPISGLDGEFVPMIWGNSGVFNAIENIKTQSNVNYVLGFNEPERANQSNVTVADAISKWAGITSGFSGTGIKLVSPGVSDTLDGRAWLTDFMTQVDADPNLRVDEVAFHWYGTMNINNPTGTANAFLNKVQQYRNDYNRNVWITEFAGIDWNNDYTTEQVNDWNAEFLKVVIPELETRSYVTRYAWWNHNNDSRLVETDSYGQYRPTVVGDSYYQTIMSGNMRELNGQSLGTDTVYLRGGKIENNGAALGFNAFERLYALSNLDGSVATSSMGGTSDWGVKSGGTVSVDANAILQKTGTGNVTWRDAKIFHDGIIRVYGGVNNAGTFSIQGTNTNAQGTGTIRLDSGSSFQLGRSVDNNGFILPYAMDYRGGSVTVDGAKIVMSGNANLSNQTTFYANKDFTISGNITGGNGVGIVKRGAATMTLTGANSFGGFTNVNEGTLAVNGSIAGAELRVNSGGTLKGSGIIATTLAAKAGGIVGPGNSAGTLTTNIATFSDQSLLIMEIASLSSFDRLVVNGALSFDPGATLQIKLLDGFVPSVGDQFDLLDFASFSGQFGNIVAPQLPTGRWDFSQLAISGVVSFTTVAVPEPATLGLLMGSGLFLLRRRRLD